MKITHTGDTLNISELKDLCAVNSDNFRSEVCRSLPSSVKTIEVDLSNTRFVDSCGLGALIGVYKTASRGNGGVTVRLVNPSPPIQQIFELTRLHRLFEVVQR
jgi:anti-sigma B factor antagonist